jgi:2'-5' RNA ligase
MDLPQPLAAAGSPPGRRILVAVVTGAVGRRIQAWRERYDAAQAARLPPHATLCYWASVEPGAALEAQVRHAFPGPVEVRLGGVREFANEEHTFYVEVLETAALDAARQRLYDRTHVALPRRLGLDWTWHVTCVRDSRGRDREVLRRLATELTVDAPWRVERIAHLELRGERYEPLAEFGLG